jgi:hypothetical protein
MDERTIVGRLVAVTEEDMYDRPFTTLALCEEAARLIEKLMADRGHFAELELALGQIANFNSPDPDATLEDEITTLIEIARAAMASPRDTKVQPFSTE